ncbi:B-cell receptor-associated protein 31 [Lamellibrachia satsuma]|nr:B-cell receptor-associated protein 31 [Lamellibrachia satsuma]
MSLQWTFIATFLYSEIALCSILMLPFISPFRWQRLFRSRMLNAMKSYANLYFNIFICVLVILFLDGIRDVRRFSSPINEGDLKNNPQAEVVLHMKLFRAQRNFYIAGFALFLFMVLRKLVTLISQQAVLQAEGEAARKQAESATQAAQTMLDEASKESSKSKEDVDNLTNEKDEIEAGKEELQKLREELTTAHRELNRSQIDLDVMKTQAEATNTEYDRLMKEHAKLQETLKTTTEGTNVEELKKLD